MFGQKNKRRSTGPENAITGVWNYNGFWCISDIFRINVAACTDDWAVCNYYLLQSIDFLEYMSCLVLVVSKNPDAHGREMVHRTSHRFG